MMNGGWRVAGGKSLDWIINFERDEGMIGCFCGVDLYWI